MKSQKQYLVLVTSIFLNGDSILKTMYHENQNIMDKKHFEYERKASNSQINTNKCRNNIHVELVELGYIMAFKGAE